MLDSLELELQVVVEKGLNHRAIFLAWSTVIFFFTGTILCGIAWYVHITVYFSKLMNSTKHT